jgi:hypothetical protein
MPEQPPAQPTTSVNATVNKSPLEPRQQIISTKSTVFWTRHRALTRNSKATKPKIRVLLLEYHPQA